MAAYDYDLIVIGAGAGGLGAAGIAREFKLKTLLIEAEAHRVGGDCLNFGCVPSKALIHVSRLAHAARQAGGYGLEVAGKVDFAAALRHVHAAQATIREHENPEHLRRQEDQPVVIGWAKFVDEHTVEVEGLRFSAERIVLATGSAPRELEVPGVEQVMELYTNENFFERERALPKRLLVIGGGPIACELGQAMQRLGSQVTIVSNGDRIAAKELPDFSRRLAESLERDGVEILYDTDIKSFADDSTAVAAVKGEDTPRRLVFDEVLVAIGRSVNTEGMDLGKAGIEVADRKITVDDTYRTTNPSVWAVGDAFGREKFSHGAEMHNRDLIVNMLSPIKKRHSLANFSWVTFTDPEIATFGYNAEQLAERGTEFETVEQPFTNDDRAIAGGYAHVAKLVLYVERGGLFGKRKLLGGSMIAPGAGELIQELVLAMQTGTPLSAIFNKIYAYPVASRINQAAVFKLRRGSLGDIAKGALRWLWRA